MTKAGKGTMRLSLPTVPVSVVHTVIYRSSVEVRTGMSRKMVGGTKAISPCVQGAPTNLFLVLHTVSTLSGEVDRVLNA